MRLTGLQVLLVLIFEATARRTGSSMATYVGMHHNTAEPDGMPVVDSHGGGRGHALGVAPHDVTSLWRRRGYGAIDYAVA